MDRDGGSVNIQDSFLGRACRERAWLTVHLNGGKRLTGRIRSFDRYTLILEDRGLEQMIFKHAIATISVSRTFSNAIQVGEGGKGKKPPPRGAAGPPGKAGSGGEAGPPGKAGRGGEAGPGEPRGPEPRMNSKERG